MCNKKLKYHVAIILLQLIQENVAAITVSVEQGMLEGGQKWTVTGDTLYTYFKGIPYAAPPIGDLRFKVRKLNYVIL